ncbi:hypothetical protein G8759_24810 [Spirosoma aureum]|uniref:Uncharacterized protein n=1 Tax=Spirosoma aureum TaxID=2692134 RepID=A0A6G9ATT3_9BACT|nr:hypothetical protein [Spirosoma aureum]QIP15623.1 hypothetical protein G8759_24810 [Spirosoma aureum]
MNRVLLATSGTKWALFHMFVRLMGVGEPANFAVLNNNCNETPTSTTQLPGSQPFRSTYFSTKPAARYEYAALNQ